MTTINGLVRSYSAAVRRAEKSRQRQHRETVKAFKEQQKHDTISNAITAVSEYENYIKTILSIHKETTDEIDWTEIKNELPPPEVVKSSSQEEQAKQNLAFYNPSLIDKLLGLKTKKIRKLELAIETAKTVDLEEFNKRKATYDEEIKNWENLQEIAIGVLNKQPDSYKNAVAYFNPFSDIKSIGSYVNFSFDNDYALIDLNVNDKSVVPDYVLARTSTGKLSKKKLPVSRFYEIYQDHVCSCALRIAREIFALLPLKFAIINTQTELLNTSTGKLELSPILSLIAYPETLSKLNFEALDPSDSMQNFIHNMKFSKINGFCIVDKLSPNSFNH